MHRTKAKRLISGIENYLQNCWKNIEFKSKIYWRRVQKVQSHFTLITHIHIYKLPCRCFKTDECNITKFHPSRLQETKIKSSFFLTVSVNNKGSLSN